MTFLIADTFTAALDRLTAPEKAAAKQAAFDLQVDPSAPGLSLHRVDRSRDRDFWTARVTRDLRIVLQDESYVGGRVALTSIPYGGVHAVSLVANKSFLGGYVEAATVSIGISGHTYEVELRGHDKARHVHDVILHYAARAH